MALAAPALNSLAGANHTIYLDFDGHVTEGTTWNSYFNNSSIRSPAYDTDGDRTSFSAGELADIQDAWQRIAEDYLPFAVNVTTVDPGVEALRKSGAGDTQWGIRVVVTADTEASGAGGIAYIDSFNWSSDTPVFVYTTGGKFIAEAASHEIGHSLGLSHDGRDGSEYYYGHGSGATSWSPLMGVGYYSEVTQWDRGEYSGATNGGPSANYGKGPSDAAVITTYNGFGYRADDHGNSLSSATALANNNGTVSGAGIISSAQDADVFTFMTGAGEVTLNVAPAAVGANLDIRADLIDAAGNLIATANPESGLAAALAVNLAAGIYYLRIDGVGVGNPAANPPSGYSDYGSIGQYSISGQIVDAGQFATIAVNDVSVSEGAGQADFTVTLSGTITEPVTVNYAAADDSAAVGQDYLNTTGAVTFEPGGPTSLVVSVPIVGDSMYEPTERFLLTLQSVSSEAIVSDGLGIGTITDDDFSLSIGDWSTREGSPNRGRKSTGPQLTPFTFAVTLSGPATHEITVRYDTVSGTAIAGSDYQTAGGTITFAPGQVSQSVTINVVADTNAETDEQFQVVLSAPSGAGLADSVGEGLIVDDDRTSGKPPKTTSTTPKKTALPKPVRDVFAWQEGAQEHDHEHDLDQGHLEFTADSAVVLVVSESVPFRSAVSPSDSLRQQVFVDWASRVATRRDDGNSDQLPVLPATSPAEIDLWEATTDEHPPTDSDWLDILANDWTA